MAGSATPTSSAGHATRGAPTNPELTLRPDHSSGADHRYRRDFPSTRLPARRLIISEDAPPPPLGLDSSAARRSGTFCLATVDQRNTLRVSSKKDGPAAES